MQKCSLMENAIIFNAISSHHHSLLLSPVIWNMKPFLDVTEIFPHINSYHLSLVKNAQAGKDNANTKTLSVKMFESACFGMMKKPLLYWNLSGNVLTGTRTIFLIHAWKIKLNLLQSTLVGLYLSEITFFFNEKATRPKLLHTHLSGSL